MRPERSTSTAGLPDGTRLEVAGGATPEEVAALVVALDAARRQHAASHGRTVPAWQRAALVEGVGGGPVSGPTGLR